MSTNSMADASFTDTVKVVKVSFTPEAVAKEEGSLRGLTQQLLMLKEQTDRHLTELIDLDSNPSKKSKTDLGKRSITLFLFGLCRMYLFLLLCMCAQM